MLAGRYPSEDFAGLRPRLVWDRTTGMLHGRPGGQRLAVTNGGTIPDRGLFGVFLAGGQRDQPAGIPGGSASWTRRWSTSPGSATCSCSAPAPGGSRTSPPTRCWSRPRRGSRAGCRSGTATRRAGRPSSAGPSAQYCRELAAASPQEATDRLRRDGLDELAAANLVSYLTAQREATGYLPDDRTLVMERFRDELGDWRLVLHSPYGARLHAPVGAGHRGPAARAVPGHGRAGAAHRRRHRDPRARRRRPAPGRDRRCSTRTRSSSW